MNDEWFFSPWRQGAVTDNKTNTTERLSWTLCRRICSLVAYVTFTEEHQKTGAIKKRGLIMWHNEKIILIQTQPWLSAPQKPTKGYYIQRHPSFLLNILIILWSEHDVKWSFSLLLYKDVSMWWQINKNNVFWKMKLLCWLQDSQLKMTLACFPVSK